jgi:ABC-type glycerol-3-phosphate transport system substrate-binding protein
MSIEEMQGVEIEFWYAAEPYLEDPIEFLMADFVGENRYDLEVNVTRFDHPDDLEAAVDTALEEGGLPDVVLAFPYQYNAWGEAGVAYVELSDYLDSPAYGLTADESAEIFPVFWERDVYVGERFGVPGLFYGQTLLYNRTWAQELGYPNPPLSDEQFITQACAAAEINADGTGGWMINTQPGSAAAWLLAYAQNLELSTGGYQFDIPEVTSAFTFLTELRSAECAWQPASQHAYDSFAARKGLFFSASTRDVSAIADAFDAANNPDTWDLIGLPNDRGETAISVYGRSYLVIESDLKQQIGAWLLVAWLTSVESQVYLAETAGYYPLSTVADEIIRENGEMPRAWVNGLELLESAYNEPRFSSWRVVRGVVQDAVAEVVRQGFAPGTLSVVIDQFQEIVDDLHFGD